MRVKASVGHPIADCGPTAAATSVFYAALCGIADTSGLLTCQIAFRIPTVFAWCFQSPELKCDEADWTQVCLLRLGTNDSGHLQVSPSEAGVLQIWPMICLL